MLRVTSIVALALLLTAAPAASRNLIAEVVTGDRLGQVIGRGGAALYVPGQGLYVSRQEALERLGPLPQEPCGQLTRCRFELFVSVPPLGSRPNDHRYRVAFLGPGLDGILLSDSTRIPGLISIGDVRETVAALEQGREPPLRGRPSEHPRAELNALDRRLGDAQDAQGPATVALTLVLLAFAAAALRTRSGLVARAALVYPLAAIALALAGAGAEQVGPVVTPLLMVVAAPLALGAARVATLTLVVPAFLAGFGLVLALSPETNALMAIGPHPWSGGRFYGVTNMIATLVLAPALAAAAALAGWRIAALGLLSIVVVGASDTGADGGGVLVFAAAFAALWLFLRRRARALPWALAGVAVLGLVFVGLDALAGGSSHVVDRVSEGPDELLHTFRERAERSVSIATSTVWQLAALLGGIGVLAWFGAQRSRDAVVDAFLVGIAVSLVFNDSPTKVAGYGAIMCAALRVWSVSHPRDRLESTP